MKMVLECMKNSQQRNAVKIAIDFYINRWKKDKKKENSWDWSKFGIDLFNLMQAKKKRAWFYITTQYEGTPSTIPYEIDYWYSEEWMNLDYHAIISDIYQMAKRELEYCDSIDTKKFTIVFRNVFVEGFPELVLDESNVHEFVTSLLLPHRDVADERKIRPNIIVDFRGEEPLKPEEFVNPRKIERTPFCKTVLAITMEPIQHKKIFRNASDADAEHVFRYIVLEYWDILHMDIIQRFQQDITHERIYWAMCRLTYRHWDVCEDEEEEEYMSYTDAYKQILKNIKSPLIINIKEGIRHVRSDQLNGWYSEIHDLETFVAKKHTESNTLIEKGDFFMKSEKYTYPLNYESKYGCGGIQGQQWCSFTKSLLTNKNGPIVELTWKPDPPSPSPEMRRLFANWF